MMKPKMMIVAMLSGLLVVGSHAAPISYSQIRSEQDVRQSTASTTNPSNKEDATTKVVNLTNESLDQPEFVRLSDGRLIPYGPGVICSEACVESDVAQPNRRWWIAVPLIGGVVAGVLLATKDPSPVRRVTDVAGTSQTPSPTPSTTPTTNPTPNPSPTPGGDQPQPVPEPGTIALLGTGLALMARKVKKMRSERN